MHTRLKTILPLCALLCAALWLASPLYVPQAASPDAGADNSPRAENLTASAELHAAAAGSMAAATDGTTATKMTFPDGDTVTVHTQTPAAGIYMIWDDIPGDWTLRTDGANGQTLACGQNGFIHEYIALPEASDSLTLEIPKGAVLCEMSFYGAGRLPDNVQTWQPPYERADFLLFPTHGDDEHLFFGGIMPYYGGELGLRVQVAYMTNHAYTEKYRVHEQLNGLWTVGIRAYPVFGSYVDEYSESLEQAQQIYDSDSIRGWQTEQIRRFRPYVIVGHDFNGEYGHGAHRLNAHLLAEAVPAAADAAQYPESAARYGVWDTPKLYIHLYNRDTTATYMDWENMPLSAFGGKTALEMAKIGYSCHESQQWMYFRVLTSGYGDCRCFGLYRSTVGEDVARNDLLEHIVFEPEPTATPDLPQTPSATPDVTPEQSRVPSPAATAAEPSRAPSQASGHRVSRPVLVLLGILAAAALAGLILAGRFLILHSRKR